MGSSLFSPFCSVSLLLLGALVSAGFQIIGSQSGNMAMAMAFEEVDSMALLPFGSGTGSFIRLPQCGGPRQTDSPQDFVAAHNAARAQVGVGPVQWDERVASFAQNYAHQRINDCRMMRTNGPYGENLAWGSSDLSGTDAVQMWVDEKQFYNYSSNTCAAGSMCSNYIQVVWRNTLRIGCAKVKCTNGRGTFIICNYDPAGNYVGERPY